jgi:hypothetical protein
VGDTLYASEQGPSSDDELNILEPGGNYGWPHVAGFRDDQAYVYANYSEAKDCPSVKWDPNHIPEGVPVQKETDWSSPDFKAPLKTFFTVKDGYTFNDTSCPPEASYIRQSYVNAPSECSLSTVANMIQNRMLSAPSHQKLAVITIPCGPGCDSTKPMFMVMCPLPELMPGD